MMLIHSAALASTDPLIPTWWEWLVVILGAAACLLTLLALVSLSRRVRTRSASYVVRWLVVIVLLPPVGAGLWFLSLHQGKTAANPAPTP